MSDPILDQARQEALKRWIAQRVAAVSRVVSAGDVLQRNGVQLRYGGDREEQISCPFHGRDQKPSARLYPEGADRRSHVWCFVCQESWDCIGLWRKFGSFEKFGAALRDMERSFGILPPESPFEIDEEKAQASEKESERQEVFRLIDSCERVLIHHKRNFDMIGFLRVGSVLDKLRYQIQTSKVSTSRATEVLRAISARIVDKARQCPED